jgi:hypothetical protein
MPVFAMTVAIGHLLFLLQVRPARGLGARDWRSTEETLDGAGWSRPPSAGRKMDRLERCVNGRSGV